MSKPSSTRPNQINTLEQAASWLSAKTGKPIDASAVIDAGGRSQLRIQVAIPRDCLIFGTGNGYGIDILKTKGMLDFSWQDCIELQVQNLVQMRSAKARHGPEVQFSRAIGVSAPGECCSGVPI